MKSNLAAEIVAAQIGRETMLLWLLAEARWWAEEGWRNYVGGMPLGMPWPTRDGERTT